MKNSSSLRGRYSFIAPLRKKSIAIVLLSILLAISLILAFLMYMKSPDMNVTDPETTASVAAGMAGILCLVLLIVVITRQEKVNTLFSSLLVVLEYNSHYLFRFYRQQARRTTPVLSIIVAAVGTVVLVVGLAFSSTVSLAGDAGTLYICAGVLYALAVLVLPYVRACINYLFCCLIGRDKHIVLSKRGILSTRRLLDFRNNSMTFFKAEYRRVGSFYCISFFYHRRRGYSLSPSVCDVPLPLDADPEMIEELLNIYNSSELFMQSRPDYMI